MFGLLDTLLGKTSFFQQDARQATVPGQAPIPDSLPAGAEGMPQVAQAPVPIEGPNEMVVQDNPYRQQLREGFFKGGPFATGKLGGNILGALGDALLAQGGQGPIYAPKLQRARESEAMIDLARDPERAIEQLSQVNPERAADLWDQWQTNQRQQSVADAQIRNADDEYNLTTHDRGINYLGAATEQSYPHVKQLVEKWYADRGVEMPYQLPDTFDPNLLGAIASSGIPMEKQATLEDNREYREAVLGQNATNETGRNTRARQAESGRNARAETAEEGRNRRAREAEEGRDRRNGASGIARPTIRFGTRADGTRYIIQ